MYIFKTNYLKQLVNQMMNAISNQTTIDVLHNIYFNGDDQQLTLKSANGDIMLTKVIDLTNNENIKKISNDAHINHCIPAAQLNTILKTFKEENTSLEINSENQMLVLTNGHAQFTLATQSGDAYPHFAEIENVENDIDGSTLQDAISRVVNDTQENESRPILGGIYFSYNENQKLVLQATDSHIGGIVVTDLTTNIQNINLPIKGIQQILKTTSHEEFNDDTKISIIQTNNAQAGIEIENKASKLLAVSRTIEGAYPGLNNIVNSIKPRKSHRHELTINRQSLVDLTNQAGLVNAANNDKIATIKYDYAKQANILAIKAGHGINEFHGEMKIENTNNSFDDPFEITFNTQKLKTVLTNFKSEQVTLYLNSALQPALIVSVDEPNNTQMIAPVRTF